MSEEINAPKIDNKIGNIFIDDNDIFSKDELTDDDKAFIKNLLDKSNYFFGNDNKTNQQRLIEADLSKQVTQTLTK